MRLLLDTCCFVWLAAAPQNLGDGVKVAIDKGADLFVSDCTVWEICLKWGAGKLVLPAPPRAWVEDQIRAWRVMPLGVAREHLYRTSELPHHHRDPFDRLLVSQAIEEKLTIATPDAEIRRYPVATCW